MPRAATSQVRELSHGEEIANSVSHGIATLAAIAALPILVVTAAREGDAGRIVGASIFGATMVLLYLTSTLYHALPSQSRAKRIVRILDHGAIYLLIAGTYTPFTLGALRGTWGWVLFGLVWGLALTGIVAKAFGAARYRMLSTLLYVGMGWLVLIAIRPLLLHVPSWGVLWLLAGGVAYTVGVVFYTVRRFRYSHFVWHLFVIAGTACHFAAVQWYAA